MLPACKLYIARRAALKVHGPSFCDARHHDAQVDDDSEAIGDGALANPRRGAIERGEDGHPACERRDEQQSADKHACGSAVC